MNKELTANIIIQNNDEFGNVRFLEVNGKPYAVASDVAKALEYKNINDAILRHCKGVVKHDIPTNGGIQLMSIIPEGDIYRLIIRSKLPTAEKFESWVMDEVLPQIRQTGGYNTITKKDRLLLGLFSDDKSVVAESYKALVQIEVEEATTPLISKIKEDKPLVDFSNQILKSSDNILIRDMAKIISDEVIKIGQNKLYEKLRQYKMLIKDSTEPYQKYIDNGVFVVEERYVRTPYGNKLTKTTKITPKGQVLIVEKLRKELYK